MTALIGPSRVASEPTSKRTGRAGVASRTNVAVVLAIALGAALAGAIAGFNLSRPGALYGVTEYDDGVYLASAIRLVAGSLPYKDFVFVQPPGITFILSPFALVARAVGSRDALGDARIFTAVIAGLNAALCGMLVRHRGAVAALVASCVLGLFPAAIYATHTLLLEPYLVVFTLVGVNLAFRRGEMTDGWRLFFAGVCLGVATSVKLWGLLIAAALVCCTIHRPRRALRLGAGVAAAGIALCGPLFALAPRAFVREVVTAQLLRRARTDVPTVSRIFDVSGMLGLNLKVTPPNSSPAGLLIVLAAALLVTIGVLVPAIVARRSLFECFAVLAAVLATLTVFVPREFYAHYVYYPAALDAVALGLAAGTFTAWIRAGIARLSRPARSLAAGGLSLCAAGFAVLVVVGALAAETSFITAHLAVADPGPTVDHHVPPGACTLSDTEVVLVVSDRISSSPACPEIVDATGTWLTDDPGTPIGHRLANHNALVRSWRSWISRAEYLVLTNVNAFRIPWTVALHRFVDLRFRLVEKHGPIIYKRRSTPLSPDQLPPRLRRA